MSENLPTAPLRNIVSKMAQKQTRGVASRVKEELEREKNLRAHRMSQGTDVEILLCDISSSMFDATSTADMKTGKILRKIDHLRTALQDLSKHYPKMRIVVFNDLPMALPSANLLPEPQGGTNLARALHFCASLKPRRTIIISDGEPDDQRSAQQEANAMTGVIDVVFCGHEKSAGQAFLLSLAKSTGGDQKIWNDTTPEMLATQVRALLAPPEEK